MLHLRLRRVGVNMCISWKNVGVAALTCSLFYNLIAFIVLATFVLRCYDDCQDAKGPYPEDCYSTFAMYVVYVLPVLSAPFIMFTDRDSAYSMQWWLLLHAGVTFCSYFIYVCYRPFYTEAESEVNSVAIAALMFSFACVAYHLHRVVRAPAARPNPENGVNCTQ